MIQMMQKFNQYIRYVKIKRLFPAVAKGDEVES